MHRILISHNMQYYVFLEQQDFRVIPITAFPLHAQGHQLHVFCHVFKNIVNILIVFRVLRGQYGHGQLKCNFAPFNAYVIDTVHNVISHNTALGNANPCIFIS